MPLTKGERIDIILLLGAGTTRSYSAHFKFNSQNADNPRQGGKTDMKFKKTGSVADASRSEIPKAGTDEDMSTQVPAAIARSPTKGTRPLSTQTGISQNSIVRILGDNEWHSYKLQMLQHLTEGDSDRRVEFCEWSLNMHVNVERLSWKRDCQRKDETNPVYCSIR
ncbi:hypothetical protein AVEN_13277-1 [Araneus ventricosus]|uniref:Uncharacterized protein n=1 Tax=Araneus ventricosus TaxID=182803 RepID=A0A4Y2EUH0_ARAVE|nr:hypothetical protein AVEN_13277-1 [Araneus ventricosus]